MITRKIIEIETEYDISGNIVRKRKIKTVEKDDSVHEFTSTYYSPINDRMISKKE